MRRQTLPDSERPTVSQYEYVGWLAGVEFLGHYEYDVV